VGAGAGGFGLGFGAGAGGGGSGAASGSAFGGASAGAALAGGGSAAGAGSCGAWARASAAASARTFIGAGAYATFRVMTSATREAWGDLATTAFVEASVLFKAFDPEARRDLLQLAHVVDSAAGELVSPEGDETFVLVREGTGAVVENGAAGPVELYRIERGAVYGVGRVLGSPRPSSLVAVSDLTAVVFPAPVVAAMVERFPKARKLLEAVRAARLREAASRRVS
jgi:hypothetical protein